MRILSFPRNTIPSLDGLRAVSIALVIFSHLGGTRGFFGTEVTHALGHLGNCGVRVFFVISGFLITTLLLSEYRKTGTISLPYFYLRRSFRIFPAAYAFLATLVVLEHTGVISLAPGDLFAGATYTANYHQNHSWFVRHLWSLSVEEQFYLLWPAVLCLAGPRRSLIIATTVLALGPVVRVAMWYLLPDVRPGLDYRFEAVADCLAAGCILALLQTRIPAGGRYARWSTSRMAGLLLPALILGFTYVNTFTRLGKPLGQTALNAAVALWIDHCIRAHRSPFGRLLNWRPVAVVGVLSYSIYLWQQLWLNRYSASSLSGFPQNLLLTAACAVISYGAVERPSLELRQRLERLLKGRGEEARQPVVRAGPRGESVVTTGGNTPMRQFD